MLGATWRVRVFGDEQVQKLRARKRPVILATWHGRMIAPVWHSRKRGIVAMVSQHRDGELVARLVHRLGYETVRGSSSMFQIVFTQGPTPTTT